MLLKGAAAIPCSCSIQVLLSLSFSLFLKAAAGFVTAGRPKWAGEGVLPWQSGGSEVLVVTVPWI